MKLNKFIVAIVVAAAVPAFATTAQDGSCIPDSATCVGQVNVPAGRGLPDWVNLPSPPRSTVASGTLCGTLVYADMDASRRLIAGYNFIFVNSSKCEGSDIFQINAQTSQYRFITNTYQGTAYTNYLTPPIVAACPVGYFQTTLSNGVIPNTSDSYNFYSAYCTDGGGCPLPTAVTVSCIKN